MKIQMPVLHPTARKSGVEPSGHNFQRSPQNNPKDLPKLGTTAHRTKLKFQSLKGNIMCYLAISQACLLLPGKETERRHAFLFTCLFTLYVVAKQFRASWDNKQTRNYGTSQSLYPSDVKNLLPVTLNRILLQYHIFLSLHSL